MSRVSTYLSVAVLVSGLGLGQSAHAAVTVRFEPLDLTVGLGDIFTIDIVADIPDPVLAWGLDATVANPPILTSHVNNALLPLPAIGPAWLNPGSTPDGDLLAGVAFPGASVTGVSVVLATLTLAAAEVGETDLLLSDDNPADLTEGFGLDPTGFAIVNYTPGHVLVTPEPGALAFLAIGILTMMRKRRQ